MEYKLMVVGAGGLGRAPFKKKKEQNVKRDQVFCGLGVCVEGNRVDNLGEMGKILVVQKIFCDTV